MLHLTSESVLPKTRIFGALSIQKCYLKSNKIYNGEIAVIRELQSLKWKHLCPLPLFSLPSFALDSTHSCNIADKTIQCTVLGSRCAQDLNPAPRAGGIAQVIKHLPRKLEALSSNHTTTKKKSLLCPLLLVWSWTSHITILSLCTIGKIITLAYQVVVRIN
jgi:hypothetical protein